MSENKAINAEELEKVSGGQSIIEEIFDTAAFTIELLRSDKLDRAAIEELIVKLQNNEITVEEIREKYLK